MVTEKRFKCAEDKKYGDMVTFSIHDSLDKFPRIKSIGLSRTFKTVDKLNELHEENIHLNYENLRLVKFIMSKGYGLKDYLDFCKEYKE